MLNWDEVLAVKENIVTRTSGEELVVVLPEQAKYVVLNATGGRVLALADGRRALQDIALAIAEESGAAVETVQADVQTFAQSMVARGILQVVG